MRRSCWLWRVLVAALPRHRFAGAMPTIKLMIGSIGCGRKSMMLPARHGSTVGKRPIAAASLATLRSLVPECIEKPASRSAPVIREAERCLQLPDCATGMSADDAVHFADREAAFEQKLLNLAAFRA